MLENTEKFERALEVHPQLRPKTQNCINSYSLVLLKLSTFYHVVQKRVFQEQVEQVEQFDVLAKLAAAHLNR